MITLAALAVSTSGVEARSALRTAINGPTELALDRNRQLLYVAAMQENRVYRVAGTGAHGHAGDEGPALAASVDPLSLAFDKSGDLFIADANNCRIRRVHPQSGDITTDSEAACEAAYRDNQSAVAPGPLVFDAAGALLFIESRCVVRVDPRDRYLTVVAGLGGGEFTGDGGPATHAQLGGPSGLAIDSTGNLFLSDFDHQRVRRVDARTGTITTIAGNGRPHVNYVQL